jgi:hypothetical protein
MTSIAAKTVDLNDLKRMESFTLRECIEEESGSLFWIKAYKKA